LNKKLNKKKNKVVRAVGTAPTACYPTNINRKEFIMRILKTFSLAGLCLLMLLSFTGSALAEPQTICPVMGGKINKEIYADYQGKRIYFCCAACPSQFNEDPEKYLAKMKATGVEPEVVPAATGDAAPVENAGHDNHDDHSNHAK
jgi:YHS domain-containing protein